MPVRQQGQDQLAGSRVAVHLETAGITNEFVGCGGQIVPVGRRLTAVVADFLPGIKHHPGLGGDTAGKMLPEFLFLALVVHGAPACLSNC